MYQVIFSFLPVALLIFLMTKKNNMPSHKALPVVAVVLYFLSLLVFERLPNLVHAAVVQGLLTALTPISIIWGAILLFKTMEKSGAMAIIQKWLNTVSSNRIAQLMIVGWAFPFLIEGASGFGTPAALAAPVLVGLGFKPLKVAIMVLIMNTIPVSFGAVGTPTWFGMSGIEDLSSAEIIEIGVKSVIIHGVAALFIPICALMFVVKRSEIIKNIGFIYLSIAATVIPYIVVAFFSYEFPALIGGFLGLICSVFFAHKGWGLHKDETENQDAVNQPTVTTSELLKASFPLYGTILILVITRIQQLGIKPLLISAENSYDIALGSFAMFKISPSLVISLNEIFGTNISWSHKILYVPSLIPFVLIVVISFFVFKMKTQAIKEVFSISIDQMRLPVYSLLAALVFVKLMMLGGESSAVAEIGQSLAASCGSMWQIFAAYLGAIGSFFSGSNTISNLTFGSIQDSIAGTLSLNRTTILALQSVGGAMGNMICINNIVAVCSVLALNNKEGYILKRTVLPLIFYGIIAAIVSYFL